jgi:hypothetical protein
MKLKGHKQYSHSRRARNSKGLNNIAIVGEQETQKALSVSCSSTMTVLLKSFQFLARRLWLYCFALSVSCSTTMTILLRPFEFLARQL